MGGNKSNRQIFWDVVKGISIVAVILIHTTGVDSIGGVVWRQFINFPVAIFFFVAGVFSRNGDSYASFIVKKFRRLAIPFIVFSIGYAAFEVYWRARKGGFVTIESVIWAMLSFPCGWGYFVLAMLQCVLLFPLFKRMSVSCRILISLSSYAIAYVYYFVGCFIFPDLHLCRCMMPFILCLPWVPMFVLGVSANEIDKFSVKTDVLISLVAMSLLMSILEGCTFYYAKSYELAFSQIKSFSILFSIAIAVLCWRLRSIRLNREGIVAHSLGVLGRYSFFVYLSHRMVLILIRGMCIPVDARMMPLIYSTSVLLIEFLMVKCVDGLSDNVRRRLWVLGI